MHKPHKIRISAELDIRLLGAILGAVALLAMLVTPSAGYSQAASQYFPETQHNVRGRFLQYWQEHGGLAQQGYPLTEEFQEKNALDGKTYTVQYFERAVFELHPENQPPYDVLLSQLGKFQLDSRYPNGSNPAAAPQTAPSGSTAPATATPAPATSIIGQTLDFPGFLGNGTLHGVVTDSKEVTVLHDPLIKKDYTAGGKYVLVFMTISNPGAESNQADSNSFRLKDGAGRTFDPVDVDVQFAARRTYNLTGYYEAIQPSLSIKGLFVFEVAADSSNYMLVAGQ